MLVDLKKLQPNAHSKGVFLVGVDESDFDVDASFVNTHGPWMLRLARRILLDEHEAEDAVQNALIAAHNNRDQFEKRSSLKTWLYRITVNAALGLRRKAQRSSHSIETLQPVFDEGACRIERPWTELVETDQVLEQIELASFVHEAVQSLPEQYRICLQLRDFEEMSVSEVADVLEITESNAKVRIHRARSALKRLIEPLLRGESLDDGLIEVDQTPTFARRIKALMTAYLPMMLTCEEFETFIIEYLEGNLNTYRVKVFELHIKTCRECREYLEAYQRARHVARATVPSMTSLDDVPTELVEAVVNAI